MSSSILTKKTPVMVPKPHAGPSSSPGTQSTTGFISRSVNKKRKHNPENDILADSQNTDLEEKQTAKKPRTDSTSDNEQREKSLVESTYSINSPKRARGMLLGTERRRRQLVSIPALPSAEEEDLHIKDASMIEDVKVGIKSVKFLESFKSLRDVAQETTTTQQHDFHLASLFKAHYGRVCAELDGIDLFKSSRKGVEANDINELKGFVDRLHWHLNNDKIFCNTIAYLNLMTDTLCEVRNIVKSTPQLEHMAYLAIKIDNIERFLTPPDRRTLDATVRSDALDDALKKQQQLEREIASMKTLHREEIVEKNKAITSLQLRHTHDLDSYDRKKQGQSAWDPNSKVELAVEKNARIAAEQQLKDERAKHQVSLRETEAAHKQQLEEKWKVQTEKEEETARVIAEKLRKEEKVQYEAEESRRQDKRHELLEKAKRHNLGIQAILDRQKDGTLALTKKEEVPSKEICIARLTEIWASKGALVAQILPHELINDHDSALEFEVEIMVTARVCMLAMQLWGCTPDELLGTGWSLSAVLRLKSGLVPYHHNTLLSSLSVAVIDICCMLQQAVDDRKPGQAPTAPFIHPDTLSAPLVSSFTNQSVPAFDHTLVSSVGHNSDVPVEFTTSLQSLTSQPYGATEVFPPITYNHMPVWQQTSGEHGILSQSVTENDSAMSVTPTSVEIYQSVPSVAPDVSHQQQSLASYPANAASTDQQPISLKGEVCHHFAKFGKCKFGDSCKYSHDVATPSQQTVAAEAEACRQWIKSGKCKFGDNCRYSHDSAAVTACNVANETYWNGDGAIQDVEMSDAPLSVHLDTRAKQLCNRVRDQGQCIRTGCLFFHPEGTHMGSAGAPSSIQVTSNSGVSKGRINKPCRNEADGRFCSKPHCIFTHQYSHSMGSLANSAGFGTLGRSQTNGFGSQGFGQHHVNARSHSIDSRNQTSQPLKGILKNPLPLAQRITHHAVKERDATTTKFNQPPVAPRASLNARITYPAGHTNAAPQDQTWATTNIHPQPPSHPRVCPRNQKSNHNNEQRRRAIGTPPNSDATNSVNGAKHNGSHGSHRGKGYGHKQHGNIHGRGEQGFSEQQFASSRGGGGGGGGGGG